jgi:hypothetical protein
MCGSKRCGSSEASCDGRRRAEQGICFGFYLLSGDETRKIQNASVRNDFDRTKNVTGAVGRWCDGWQYGLTLR